MEDWIIDDHRICSSVESDAMDHSSVNPATGLSMVGLLDIGGYPYGCGPSLFTDEITPLSSGEPETHAVRHFDSLRNWILAWPIFDW